MLVVGINYAPEPTGIAPYTTGMAEHLALTAGSITVLTGVPHYPNWRVPGEYRWVLRSHEAMHRTVTAEGTAVGGLHLRRLRHYVPRRQSALTRAAYEATFLANAATVRLPQIPEVIVAVTPSLGGAVAAVPLARRYGAKLVVVVQDMMAKAASQSGISGGGRAARATAALERFALRQADLVVVVSDAFRSQLHEYGVPDERIRLMPNWSHIGRTEIDRDVARMVLGWPTDPFTIVHTGNIGLKQDLGNLVEAARLTADDADLRFVIVGDGSQCQAVREQATGLPNMHFVGPLDDDHYPLALAAADVLVVNERPGVADMSLPSKLTSYLVAGRPILAAVGDGGATSRELTRTGGAALVVPPGDPAAFVDGVRRLYSNPDLCEVMAMAGRTYADQTLGKDVATARLEVLLHECLSVS